MDLRQIKVNEDDFGLMAYDPAFTNTASCRSAITYIDGDAGHPPAPRRSRSSSSARSRATSRSPTCSIFGELPTEAAARALGVRHHPPHLRPRGHQATSSRGFRYDAHPMGMLLSGVGALSTFYPDAKQIDDPEERYMAAIRLIAKVPTLAAFAYRHNMGLPYVYPDNDLDLLRELPLDDVQEDRGQVRARPAAREGARRALHPPRRPRAELLDQRRARASAPRRSTPTRRSPPASPRSTARCTAAPTRRCCGCCAGSRRSRTSPTSSRASRTARRS